MKMKKKMKMKIRDEDEHTSEAEESGAEKNNKKSDESSIFSTILTDIEENPTILQNSKTLSAEFSIFSTIFADVDEENPTILQENITKFKKIRRRASMKTPIDFTSTVAQTLTRSYMVDILNQELKILKSEMEIKGQTSDRTVSCNPKHDRECDCVEEGKVEQRDKVTFLADEVIEWLLKGEIVESEISGFPTDAEAEDPVCKVEDGNNLESLDVMLSTMLGDDGDLVNDTEGCGRIDDEFIEEMLEEIEKDASYLDRIKDGYAFGGLLESILRDRLSEKAEKEEKEISSWINDGEPLVENGVAEEEKEEKRDIKEKKKKMTPMVVVKMERTKQESTVTKRDCTGYKRRLYLIEKLRERHANLMKRRVKAARCGMELSFLVAEYMFLIPNEILGETGDYRMCTNIFGVNEDDKGTSVIIGMLETVFGIVNWKKENKEHNVKLPDSIFRFDDFIRLCADAVRALGMIVLALKRNHNERLKLSDLESLFEDCQKRLMKIELKLAEMKQQVYRSVSADYESFSKSERFDSLLRRKLMKRVNADNSFRRSLIGPYLVEIWRSVFQTEALQVQ